METYGGYNGASAMKLMLTLFKLMFTLFKFMFALFKFTFTLFKFNDHAFQAQSKFPGRLYISLQGEKTEIYGNLFLRAESHF